MAMIIILIVKSVECCFLPIVQGTVDEVVLYSDTRMKEVRILTVGHKQYVAYQGVQSVSDPYAVFIVLAGKESFHFALSVELRTHAVHFVRVGRLNKGLFADCDVGTKPLFEGENGDLRSQDFLADR